MDSRKLADGPEVSVLALGCNNFGGRLDREAARAVVHRALDLGITMLDTADVYPAARLLAMTEEGEESTAGGDGAFGASETILGQILGPQRKDVVLATKFGMPMDRAMTMKGGSRRYMAQAVEASLRRLRTDWIDLYYLHVEDPDTPLEESIDGLDALVREGKIRAYGFSNHSPEAIARAARYAHASARAQPVAVQAEYSLLERENETTLIPTLLENNIALLAYFPLASGLLTGKYATADGAAQGRLSHMRLMREIYMTESNLARVDAISRFAAARGYSMIELAFGWLLSRPGVGGILAGATSPAQVEQNARATERQISAEDLAALKAIITSAAGASKSPAIPDQLAL